MGKDHEEGEKGDCVVWESEDEKDMSIEGENN